MRLIHIADLHLGVRINEFTMIEEQRFVLGQIRDLAAQYQADAVLISGDVYDRSVPPVEAVQLLDSFLTSLPCPACIISGNHDSAERLEFGAGFLEKQGIHIQGTLKKPVVHVDFEDPYGTVEIWMLPFVRPETVRPLGFSGTDYQAAVNFMMESIPKESPNRRILMAHQYVVSDETARRACNDLTVGGLDQICASCFQGFDYVALGHIHAAQSVESPNICYSGTPLKYSFSEVFQEKRAVLVTIQEKGQVELTSLGLRPLHDWREIRGPIGRLCDPLIVSQADPQDYIRAILTDEEVYDAVGQLRSVYPNLMRIDFDNSRTRNSQETVPEMEEPPEMESLEELFAKFYEDQCQKALPDEDRKLIRQILNKGEAQ